MVQIYNYPLVHPSYTPSVILIRNVRVTALLVCQVQRILFLVPLSTFRAVLVKELLKTQPYLTLSDLGVDESLGQSVNKLL